MSASLLAEHANILLLDNKEGRQSPPRVLPVAFSVLLTCLRVARPHEQAGKGAVTGGDALHVAQQPAHHPLPSPMQACWCTHQCSAL